ncbi:hypothetical protein B0T24DRAFT_290224 [Lasiosphaeria ovina]|uniref:FAD-binding PCMH-type domain-containing protein n=1 Tax=Lasiosphaeria ovina TaxID=92902 RepID=A0AAE0KDN2_9PEZI|nr:hypothetical protein B0T24DRAFT_290224 [Lasiosphaeria ovina]
MQQVKMLWGALWVLALSWTGSCTKTVDGAHACNALAAALPGLVTFPNSSLFATENTYWSLRQEAVTPDCFVAPKTTGDVAKAVKLLTSLPSPFTVKGGGHTAFAGASNIENGVTIDMFHLNQITVAVDRKTVSVGPGARWINVSTALDPLGLAVVGGRDPNVGVSGLTLGGGISFFSGIHGLVCDNVRRYEVVLASGKMVEASPTANANLYWALRGGTGSNFGIVTRFDLASFEQGDLWSAELIYPGALNATLIPLFQNLTVNGLPADPQAHTYFVQTYIPALGGYIVLTDQYRATPLPGAAVPPVFQPLHAVPALITQQKVANVSTTSRGIEEAYGERHTWWNTAVSAASAQLLVDLVPLYEAHVQRLLAAANGTAITPFFIFQPLPVNVLRAMQANGGNALGLYPADGPLVIVQLAVTWENAAIDSAVEASCQKLIGQVKALAASRKLDRGFIYVNYAGKSQDVFRGYGAANLARLKRVAKTVDPQGLLQRLWKGYFKLDSPSW